MTGFGVRPRNPVTKSRRCASLSRSRPHETLGQLALDGVGITRVGNFGIVDDMAAGRLVPVLEAFNPGDVEPIHAVFVGGTNMPARVRVFIDYLTERLR